MKLTDTNKIRDYVKEQINPYGKPFEGSVYELGLKLIKYLENMSTDYDVDKVVKELNELEVKGNTRYKNGDFGDFDGVDYYIKKSDAIEIVKQGDISDDMCEWKYDEHFEFAKSDCGSMDTHRIDFRKLKYCPYCGNKIKVVE